MTNHPHLETERLLLNQPEVSDLDDLVFLLNQSKDFSNNTLNLPYPYTKDSGEFWLNLAKNGLKNKDTYIFAIRDKNSKKIIGGIGLHLDSKHLKSEVGYWIGKDFWGQGLVTEALKKIIEFGFKDLQLNKIYATHFPHNPASGKIMLKANMRMEGILSKEFIKNGQPIDVIRYAILKEDL